jgi:hypothetical protein
MLDDDVCQIQNGRLYCLYQAHKLTVMGLNSDSNANERILFHGTSPDAVEDIARHGFNRSYCGKNAALYGRGAYFAKSASYAKMYSPAAAGSTDRRPAHFKAHFPAPRGPPPPRVIINSKTI